MERRFEQNHARRLDGQGRECISGQYTFHLYPTPAFRKWIQPRLTYHRRMWGNICPASCQTTGKHREHWGHPPTPSREQTVGTHNIGNLATSDMRPVTPFSQGPHPPSLVLVALCFLSWLKPHWTLPPKFVHNTLCSSILVAITFPKYILLLLALGKVTCLPTSSGCCSISLPSALRIRGVLISFPVPNTISMSGSPCKTSLCYSHHQSVIPDLFPVTITERQPGQFAPVAHWRF